MYNTQEQFPHGPKMPPVATAFLDKNMSIHVDIQSSSQLGGGRGEGRVRTGVTRVSLCPQSMFLLAPVIRYNMAGGGRGVERSSRAEPGFLQGLGPHPT